MKMCVFYGKRIHVKTETTSRKNVGFILATGKQIWNNTNRSLLSLW